MNAAEFYKRIQQPAADFAQSLNIQINDGSQVLMLAIAGQESGWSHRFQQGGPARSFWQFESSGLWGVVSHQRARTTMLAVCKALAIADLNKDLFEAIAYNDAMAFCAARMLLWIDTRPLPAIGDKNASWDYYIRNWRPGKPRREDWDAVYAEAQAAVTG